MADSEPHLGPWQVTARDIAKLRRRVHDTARRAGLPPERADRYTFAVNEIVINAIQHGDGTAEVSITHSDDDHAGSVTVTVLDHGPGWNGEIPDELPPSDRTHGRGLWLAHRMCDDVTIRSSPGGTQIALRVAAAPAGGSGAVSQRSSPGGQQQAR